MGVASACEVVGLTRVLMAAGIGLGVLVGCGGEAPAPAGLRPALVQTVNFAAVADTASFPGEVRARYEIDLGFRIAGKLVERTADTGAAVRKGEALARLDPADVDASARAARAQAVAAETDLALAAAEVGRARMLVSRNFVSRSVLDTRESAYKAAQARLEQARAQLAVAQNQAGYTTLAADHDGVITAVLAEAGQVVSAGQPVFRLARPDEKEILIAVPEGRLAELRHAGELAASLWAAPDRFYRAKLREVAPNADPVTRSFAAKVALLDEDESVGLGMTANVFLGRAAGSAAAAKVPLSALGSRDGKPVLWVVAAHTGEVQPRQVEVGAYLQDGATVVSGVKDGEQIVVAGVHKLVAGQRVRPVVTQNAAMAPRR